MVGWLYWGRVKDAGLIAWRDNQRLWNSDQAAHPWDAIFDGDNEGKVVGEVSGGIRVHWDGNAISTGA